MERKQAKNPTGRPKDDPAMVGKVKPKEAWRAIPSSISLNI
jgi:hypothetical protein